jgi:hypothetical protein
MNRPNKSLSMNVFQLRGMAFIPDNKKPDLNRESDAERTSLDKNFQTRYGDLT